MAHPSVDRLHDERGQVGKHVLSARVVAAPPGLDRRQPRLTSSQMSGDRRKEREERRALDDPAAEGIHDRDGLTAGGVEQTGHAEL